MINTFQSTVLILFGILAYMMWVDENVSVYLILLFRVAKVRIERCWWMIRFHPQNPITNLIMRWKYDKIAKEFQNEIERSRD